MGHFATNFTVLGTRWILGDTFAFQRNIHLEESLVVNACWDANKPLCNLPLFQDLQCPGVSWGPQRPRASTWQRILRPSCTLATLHLPLFQDLQSPGGHLRLPVEAPQVQDKPLQHFLCWSSELSTQLTYHPTELRYVCLCPLPVMNCAFPLGQDEHTS